MTPITYFNRYTGEIEEEQVYGGKALSWVYGSQFGGLALQALVKRRLFSKIYGAKMNRPASAKSIGGFVRDYGLDAKEFVKEISEFENFNDFFARELKPQARPIHEKDESSGIVFPADGRHILISDLSEESWIYAKGQQLLLPDLLGSEELAEEYRGGTAVISRLCPTDYHRFHFPCQGVPKETRQIQGALYSVSPLSLGQKLSRIWENKRQVTVLDTDTVGELLLLEVGATCVGSIVQSCSEGEAVSKGQEKGYFLFGGSMCISIFKEGRLKFAADLQEQSEQGRELYAKMGDYLAEVL